MKMKDRTVKLADNDRNSPNEEVLASLDEVVDDLNKSHLPRTSVKKN